MTEIDRSATFDLVSSSSWARDTALASGRASVSRPPTNGDGAPRSLTLVPATDLLDELDVSPDVAVAAVATDRVLERAIELGIRRVQVISRRDLEAPGAGGSELHADKIASIWAALGLDVTLRTGAAPNLATKEQRNGYDVVRKAGRVSVFPRTAARGVLPRRHGPDGVMEIWQGMPFFTPLWARYPRVTFVHYVHGEAWRTISHGPMAKVGGFMEMSLAPRVYRRSRLVTACESAREDIISLLGLHPSQVKVVPLGVDAKFSPGGVRSPEPLVVAVGRLASVKRFDFLIDSLIEARRRIPELRAVIVGEGRQRGALEAKIRAAGAEQWIELPGYMPAGELVDTYRRAWVVASSSSRESWNLPITEAAACGTPAVATDTVGHRDAIWHGASGLLADADDGFAAALVRVLHDVGFRDRLSRGALERSKSLTWEATATGTLAALVEDAEARL